MKKLKIIALLLALGASNALAQRPQGERHHGDMMQKNIERLDSIVELTDDQKIQILSLNEGLKVKMKEAKMAEDHEAMNALRQKHKTDIDAILSPAQRDLLKAAKTEQKETMKAMKSELKTYKQENIVPALKLKRSEFDQVLSAEEKATISDLQTELKAIRKSNNEPEDKHRSKLEPEQRKELKLKLDAALSPIVAAHKAELDQVDIDLKPLRDTWKEDMKAIKVKHNPTCDNTVCASKQQNKKNSQGKTEKTSSMGQYKFLLMKFE